VEAEICRSKTPLFVFQFCFERQAGGDQNIASTGKQIFQGQRKFPDQK